MEGREEEKDNEEEMKRKEVIKWSLKKMMRTKMMLMYGVGLKPKIYVSKSKSETSKKKGLFIMTGVTKINPESKTKKPEGMEQIVLPTRLPTAVEANCYEA